MRSNKKLIVIISIILTLAIASSILAYLFLLTDVFKSNEELFAKYFTQNVQNFQKNVDLQAVRIYQNLKNENKYESNTNIKMLHSEGGEISNPLNNLEIKLDVQKDNEQQYLYADGQILYEDEKYLEAEIIKEQGMYGVRFTDSVKQFITIKNDGKIETIANSLGMESTELKQLINIIDGNELTIQGQSTYTLKDKYLNIISKYIEQGTFEKQKKVTITYNEANTETNAYSVLINSEQVKNMLLEILNNMKKDMEKLDIDETINSVNEEMEIPTIKLTVYEQKQQTIRTVAEIGKYIISMENINQNAETKTKINYLDENEGIESNIEISKENIDSQENFDITINVIEPNESYTITLSNKIQFSENKIELDTQINHKQDITTMSLILKNETILENDFEKNQTLSSNNNMVLNNLEEEKIKILIEKLKPIVSQKTNERINLLKQKFGINDEENLQQENDENQEQITQMEINKFNSKFEFYTGDEVSAENVKMLLDIAKNHMANYEIISDETQEQNKKINIKLKIEKDVINEEAINQFLEKINNSKKYKVLITYVETNGLIDYITITEL